MYWYVDFGSTDYESRLIINNNSEKLIKKGVRHLGLKQLNCSLHGVLEFIGF